jgi:hypothetical protein
MSFKRFFKLEFLKKPTFLKFWKKNHKNCSLSWPHIWKVSFWDLNGILFFLFVLFHRPFKIFLKSEFLKKTYLFKILKKKITKTVHYLVLTYGKFHSRIWMLKIWFTWYGMTHWYSKPWTQFKHTQVHKN